MTRWFCVRLLRNLLAVGLVTTAYLQNATYFVA